VVSVLDGGTGVQAGIVPPDGVVVVVVVGVFMVGAVLVVLGVLAVVGVVVVGVWWQRRWP
jgi:hypothetical protein